MRVVVILAIFSVLAGCSYKNEKALRQYNEELEPIRGQIVELSRYQGYVNEKKSPHRIQDFVNDEILTRARKISNQLQGLRSKNLRIKELNAELADIWMEYVIGFELFSQDLSNINLLTRQAQIQRVLERCSVRWRSWNAELLSFHETVVGWAG
jgi:hypothetical protein